MHNLEIPFLIFFIAIKKWCRNMSYTCTRPGAIERQHQGLSIDIKILIQQQPVTELELNT